ncbi:hypothetical protein EVA_19772, partial [gut metagenome]
MYLKIFPSRTEGFVVKATKKIP